MGFYIFSSAFQNHEFSKVKLTSAGLGRLIFQAREHMLKRFKKQKRDSYLANAHSHFRQRFPKPWVFYCKINVCLIASTDFQSKLAYVEALQETKTRFIFSKRAFTFSAALSKS